MALAFKKVSCPPIRTLTASAPDGALIGVIGEDGAGKGMLLRLAAGLAQPVSGSVSAGKTRRLIGPGDPLSFAPVHVLALEHAFAQHDLLVRARAVLALDRLRRSGTTVLMASHEEDWLRRTCDEIWWLREGELAARGEPATVLEAYRAHAADKMRAWGETITNPVDISRRRGDHRAEIVSLDTLGDDGERTAVWRSGEPVEVRVTLRYVEAVPDPVIGLLIRSRVGLDVYGTNSELEKVKLGPRAPGDSLKVAFRFTCDLCPQEYTLTVASHDPDGTRHDWLDEAVSITVTDKRHTAGVANLRARIEVLPA